MSSTIRSSTPREGGRAIGGALVDAVEKEVEHLRPRRRIHDAHLHSALREKQRERDLGAAAIAIGVDVRQQSDGAPRRELGRVALDRRGAVRGNGEKIGESRGHVVSK